MATVVRENELIVRVFGLLEIRVPIDCINSVEIVPYDARSALGGWGYQRLERGLAFLPRGDRAIEIVISDGRRVLIGSQRHEELCQVLTNRQARSASEG